ncbi:MAG: tRNA (adenosine(37)-N6)-dimethylallyltransferase MiaA [Clostridia bacterium]|nr:tRNA (adenosine(37)-N6)-dimethylallyltransferase MiaA [Clostridia bacterium]
MAKKIIAVAGPTASGKTALAIEIAKRVAGEVVSCDSMQIYKGMDIGTAKPDMEERCGIPHHMIDIVDPSMRYSVADFTKDARACIDDILSRDKVPVIAGGTGLYMDSVLLNIEFDEFEQDMEYRSKMQKYADEWGNEALHNLLLEKDPEAAAKIHQNNVRRVIRALEVCHTTGKTFTQVNAESRRELVYDPLIFGIDADRQVLYERIDRRVDIMLEKGLLDEVRRLYESGLGRETTAMQAIGYKELFDFIEDKCTYDEAVEKIKQESRRYAKRQLTWFRRNELISWVRVDGPEGLEEVYKKCFTFLGKAPIL